MGRVENNYKKAVEYFYNEQDAITTLIWARRTLEIIVKAAVKKWKPNLDTDTRLADLIKIIKKEKLVSELALSHIRTIQNFGNYATHDTDLTPDKLKITDIVPVNASLKFLYDWYKNDLESFVESEISPMHRVAMNSDGTFTLKPEE